jgi:hypothetical protein
MGRNLRGPARSLLAAVVIVTIGMIALTASDHSDARLWRVIRAPVIPAVYTMASFFIGGFHGVSLSRNQSIVVVFVIALLMWWVVLECCRDVWRLVRAPRE